MIDQLFDPPCVPPGAVRNVERDNVIRAGLEHVVRTVRFQIALIRLSTKRPVELRSVADSPPRVEVRFAGPRIIETFQDDESGKTIDASDRTFVDLIWASETRTTDEENNYRWIDLLALQIGHIDLEVPEGILGQPNFIRWGPPGDIHGVSLPHHRDDRSRIGPNPCSVKGAARGIDIEPS